MEQLTNHPELSGEQFVAAAKKRALSFYREHTSELPGVAFDDYFDAALEAWEPAQQAQRDGGENPAKMAQLIDEFLGRFLKKEQQYRAALDDPALAFHFAQETIGFVAQSHVQENPGALYEERVRVAEQRAHLLRVLDDAEKKMTKKLPSHETPILAPLRRNEAVNTIAKKLELPAEVVAEVRDEYHKQVMLTFALRLRPEIYKCLRKYWNKKMSDFAKAVSRLLPEPVTEDEARTIYYAADYLSTNLHGFLAAERPRWPDLWAKISDEAITAGVNNLIPQWIRPPLRVEAVGRLLKMCD